MKPTRPHDPEFFRLLWAVVDGSATPEENARLEKLVLEDPAAARTYVLFTSLHADLLWQNQSGGKVGILGQEANMPHAVSPAPHSKRPSNRFSRPMFWMFLAASVLFAGYLGVLTWNMRASKLRLQKNGGAEHFEIARDTAEGTLPIDKSAMERTTAPIGKTIAIESGIVEVRLKQGASMLVEGPAQWTVNDANSAALDFGKFIARVPEKAHGFTVTTPTTTVVDLGTEFAVRAKKSGLTDVHVIEGSIEVAQLDGDATKPIGQLKAGQSVHIGDGKVSKIESGKDIPDEFRTLSEYSRDPKAKPVAATDMPDVDLAVDMPFTMDWNNPQAWGGESPKSGKRYHMARGSARVGRSPQARDAAPFGGSELVIHKNGLLGLKHSGESSVPCLTLNGGKLQFSGTLEGAPPSILGGKIRVSRDSELGAGPITYTASIDGNGDLIVTGPGMHTLRGDGRKFSGNWKIQNAQVVAMAMDSLGTGNVTVESKGVLDVRYQWKNPKARLSLAKEAKLNLGFNISLGEVLVDGKLLPAGTHTLKELKQSQPGYFTGANDTLTVEITASPVVAKPEQKTSG